VTPTGTPGRVALSTVLLLLAIGVQFAALARLRLPGATPDLVLLVALALALAYGPAAGMAIGFGAGLALDLAPPADHPVGQWAMVLCLVGYLAGLVREDAGESVLIAIVVVAFCAAVANVLYAGVGGLLGDPRITWSGLVGSLPAVVLYDILLTPFVVPAIGRLAARRRPAATPWRLT
jgi:rod shape-determining protein MreD